MDDVERRAKHAAYMRSWYNNPENRERARQQARARYRANRDVLLSKRRERDGSGPRRRRWTTGEILDAIRQLADPNGYATCPTGGSLPGVAANRFGSWSAACEAAGVTPSALRPLKATAKYSTVHSRLNAQRGKPSRCEECGTTDPDTRYEWGLNLEVRSPKFNEKGHPYSTDLNDYRRLCKSCHIRQDLGRKHYKIESIRS